MSHFRIYKKVWWHENELWLLIQRSMSQTDRAEEVSQPVDCSFGNLGQRRPDHLSFPQEYKEIVDSDEW